MIIFQLLKGFFRSWRKFTFPIIFCLNLQHFEKLNHKKSVTFYFLQYFTLCHSTHSGLVIVVQSNSKNCHLTPDECDHCAPPWPGDECMWTRPLAVLQQRFLLKNVTPYILSSISMTLSRHCIWRQYILGLSEWFTAFELDKKSCWLKIRSLKISISQS